MKKVWCIIVLFLLVNVYCHSQTFQTLGNGLRTTGMVRCIEYDSLNDRIFVAGHFSQIDNCPANNIAYKDSTGWHAFGNGIDGYIAKLKYANGKLFVAGQFNTINGVPVNNIACWDGLNWNAMGNGIGVIVNSMEWYDSALYVSGNFTVAGGITVNGIAKWDGNNWSSIGSGPDQQEVYLKIINDTLYIYGEFTKFNGFPARQVVAYDGLNWSPRSLFANGSLRGNLFNYQNMLCAFVYNGATTMTNLKSYYNNAWNNLAINVNVTGITLAFSYQDTVYFTSTPGSNSDTAYLYKMLPSGITLNIGIFSSSDISVTTEVDCATSINGSVYFGGFFRYWNNQFTGGVIKMNNNNFIAPFYASTGYYDSYNNSFGFGMYYDTTSNKLIAGGSFDFAGDTLAKNIASWNGSKWEPMGSGLSGDSFPYVRKIYNCNGQLYAGGRFHKSGNKVVNNIAVWNGSDWDSIGTGADARVLDMIYFGNRLYVIGEFNTFNGLTNTTGIVSFDGNAWSKVTGFQNNYSYVWRICVYDSLLLIAGDFTIGGNTSQIISYDGFSWNIFPSPSPSASVKGLINIQGTLYSCDGGVVYKFDGVNWINTGYPLPEVAAGFYLNSFYNQLIVADGWNGITSIQDSSGQFPLFCRNLIYNSLTIDSTHAYIAGPLPDIYFNGHIINNIAIVTAQPPSVQFTFNEDTICDHQYIHFNAPNTDILMQYQWNFPGGIPNQSSALSPVIRYTVPGSYDVSLKVSNSFGSDSVYRPNLIHVNNCSSGIDQMNDITWIFGYHYSPMVAGLDFSYGNPDTVSFNPPFDFLAGADVSISDGSGNLQFYSNGDQVANWNNQLLQNSGGFNKDTSGLYNYWDNNLWQGIISVPYPGLSNQYALFHISGITLANSGDFLPVKLYYSKINMNLNGGLGKMTLKRNIVFQDTLLPCILQATKHGNGRDWWIINHKAFSDKFYLTLLTPNGISQNLTFNTGPYLTFFNYSEGQSNFSPDGSLYAISYNTRNVVYLFDFDRCNGSIIFRDSVKIIPTDSLEWPVWGCSFSPNSRYLYATTNNDLYQYDTWATNLAASQIHIANFDGFGDPFENYFFRHAIGPDGKIYMTSWGGTRYLHVINDPDMADSLCDFSQHQLRLSNYHASLLPEFPNYRLGNLIGSPCDTLTYIKENTFEEINLKISPNPNNGQFLVNYSLAPNTQGKLTVSDLFGKIVFEKTLPEWSIVQQFDLSELSEGMYQIKIENKTKSCISKFVKL